MYEPDENPNAAMPRRPGTSAGTAQDTKAGRHCKSGEPVPANPISVSYTDGPAPRIVVDATTSHVSSRMTLTPDEAYETALQLLLAVRRTVPMDDEPDF